MSKTVEISITVSCSTDDAYSILSKLLSLGDGASVKLVPPATGVVDAGVPTQVVRDVNRDNVGKKEKKNKKQNDKAVRQTKTIATTAVPAQKPEKVEPPQKKELEVPVEMVWSVDRYGRNRRIVPRTEVERPEDTGRYSEAAYLMLIRKASSGSYEFAYAKRAAHARRWPNGYDFSAGGMMDAKDASPYDAAYREAAEEIGLQPRAESRLNSSITLTPADGYFSSAHVYVYHYTDEKLSFVENISTLEWLLIPTVRDMVRHVESKPDFARFANSELLFDLMTCAKVELRQRERDAMASIAVAAPVVVTPPKAVVAAAADAVAIQKAPTPRSTQTKAVIAEMSELRGNEAFQMYDEAEKCYCHRKPGVLPTMMTHQPYFKDMKGYDLYMTDCGLRHKVNGQPCNGRCFTNKAIEAHRQQYRTTATATPVVSQPAPVAVATRGLSNAESDALQNLLSMMAEADKQLKNNPFGDESQ